MALGIFDRISPKRMSNIHRLRGMSPAALLIAAYVLAIALGTVLLVLPVSSSGGATSVVDALFTSASAICVTGLIVVDTGTHYSGFGQAVIAMLIQAGGLGIMTFSVFFMLLLGARVPFRHRLLMQESYASHPVPEIYSLVKAIFIFTFLAEVLGAVFLFFCFLGDFPPLRALYVAIFHSVSAFCNAGFSTFSESMAGYVGNIPVNLIFMVLIILGGLGFPVVYEAIRVLRDRGRKRRKLSLQVKIVVLTTGFFILGGFLFFFASEYTNLLKPLGVKGKLLASFFTSITARTAGFNTLDTTALTNPSLVMLLFFMFVGASPGSCGGGIKTTTFAVVVLSVVTSIKGKTHVNCFKKTIAPGTVFRAITLLLVSVGFVFVVSILIMVFETSGTGFPAGRGQFIEYLFEVVSAFGTVGLSMGVTGSLTTASKLLLTGTMLAGRVGVLSLAYVVMSRSPDRELEYASENLMIG